MRLIRPILMRTVDIIGVESCSVNMTIESLSHRERCAYRNLDGELVGNDKVKDENRYAHNDGMDDHGFGLVKLTIKLKATMTSAHIVIERR